MKINNYIKAGILATMVQGLASCSSDFLEENYTTDFRLLQNPSMAPFVGLVAMRAKVTMP